MVKCRKRCVIPCSIKLESSPPTDNSGNLKKATETDGGIVEDASGLLFLSSMSNFVVSVLPAFLLPDSLKNTYFLFPRSRQKISVTISKDLVLSSVIGWKIDAKPMMAWKSSTFASSLEKLLVPQIDWTVPKDKSTSETTSNVRNLSWFVLYEAVLSLGIDEYELPQRVFQSISISKLRCGTSVLTRSFPFGCEIESFSDTVSCGVISNIFGRNDALVLIDAHCLPGSEGGGVFLNDTSKSSGLHSSYNDCPIAMIVASLCWKSDELIGFTVCCSIKEIFSSILDALSIAKKENLPHFMSSKLDNTESFLGDYMNDHCMIKSLTTGSKLHSAFPDVVQIEVGTMWGSGVVVLVDENHGCLDMIIVTCRHVVEKIINKVTSEIKVHFMDITKCLAGKLLYHTSENSCYDLAVLCVECKLDMIDYLCLNKQLLCINNVKKELHVVPHVESFNEFVKGSKVFVKGHGLFDVVSGMKSTLSSGVLSGVVRREENQKVRSISWDDQAMVNANGAPVLLHSTCAVHKGASGGALISQNNGKLLGIVINHIRDESIGVSYPNANFCIPVNIFMPCIIRYCVTGNILELEALNCFDRNIKNVWLLENCSGTNQVLRSRL